MTEMSFIMEKDWLFKTSEYICDLRVAGVLIRNGKLLVQREIGGVEYALPGGHVKIGETTEAALIREYQEEMNLVIECKHLLCTEECFWEWNGVRTHNISFYYLIEDGSGLELPEREGFLQHRDNKEIEYGWLPIDQLQNITIYPEFIKHEIFSLDGKQKHFTTRA